MRTFVRIFFALTICSVQSIAQRSQAGIYKNGQDYKNHVISVPVNCDSGVSINLHHIFSGNYIDIKSKGAKTRLYKDSIFGYRNCADEDFRFYKTNDEEYRILETGNIVIYECYEVIRSSNGHISKTDSVYFFSKTLSSPILPLTVLNLKNAFPDNLKFHDMLDREFGNKGYIAEYYSKGNTYKVNYLLAQSLN